MADHWWNTYGNFREGSHGLPHFGDVLKHYRKIRGYSIEEVAKRYGATTRYVYYLESSENMGEPKSPDRREALASILGIPLALIGLGVKEKGVMEYVGTEELKGIESVLPVLWEAYYTGDFQTVTKGIPVWIGLAERAARNSTGTAHDQFVATMVRFLHVQTTAERDRSSLVLAQMRGSSALSLSNEINNVDLILASFHRLFRVHMQAGDWKAAEQSVTGALSLIKRVKPDSVPAALVGTAYTDAGEIFAQIGTYDSAYRAPALTYLDKAAHVARTIKPEDMSSEYIRFSIVRVMNERAAAGASFKMSREASSSIGIAEKNLSSTNVRYTKDHLLASIAISLSVGDVDNAMRSMMKSIALHKETNSTSNYPWMIRQVKQAQIFEPFNPYLLTVTNKLAPLVH